MARVSDVPVAVVTGGVGGLGSVISTRLLEQHYHVISLSRKGSVQDISEAGINITEPGFCDLKFDITDFDQAKPILKSVANKLGRIDVLINNAGLLTKSKILDITVEEWMDVINTNLTGAFFLSQAAIPYLKRSTRARIVNISSNAGRMGGFSSSVAYSASKGGLNILTYALATRLAKDSITVNCVAPGPIKTEMFRNYSAKEQQKLKNKIPTGRLCTPDEVAAAIIYLVSDKAASVTGAILDINGGLFVG